MSAREEMDVIAEFEMNVELSLREPEPVSEETLDLHGDEVMDALERSAAEIALGSVISMDIPNSTIEILFDLLGDSDAEIYEKLAELIRVILRDTGLPLRVARVEAVEIDWEARAPDHARSRESAGAPAA